MVRKPIIGPPSPILNPRPLFVSNHPRSHIDLSPPYPIGEADFRLKRNKVLRGIIDRRPETLNGRYYAISEHRWNRPQGRTSFIVYLGLLTSVNAQGRYIVRVFDEVIFQGPSHLRPSPILHPSVVDVTRRGDRLYPERYQLRLPPHIVSNIADAFPSLA